MGKSNYANNQYNQDEKNVGIGKKLINWFGLSIFVIVGIILIIVGGYYTDKSLKTTKWPSTDGKILTSEIVLSSSGSGRNKSSSYNLNVSYAYAVDGQGYTGRKISVINLGTGLKGYLKNLQSKYCVGQDVKVFYNPQDPEEAVLEQGIKIANGFFFAIGLFFIVCIIPFILARIKKSNKFRKGLKYFGFVLFAVFLLFFVPLIVDLIWKSFFAKTISCAKPKSSIESRYDQCPTLIGEEKDSCYFGVAGTSLWKDALICDKISDDSQYKGVCYSMIAQRINDVSLCSKIPDGFDTNEGFYTNRMIKDQCYNYFKNKNNIK